MTRSKQYHSTKVILNAFSIQQVDKKNEGLSSQAGEKDATQKYRDYERIETLKARISHIRERQNGHGKRGIILRRVKN